MNPLNFKRLYLFVSLCFLLFNNSFTQPSQIKLNEYLAEFIKLKNIPSVSAGILSEGIIMWTGAAGYSDVENSIPATNKTIYRIASISKPITAVAILQLAEKGKINLDEDARKYIPYFPQKKWKFTVRQLLNHTSGIRNYKTADEFNNKEHFNTTEQALMVIMNDPLNFKPGTRFQYTTLGYNLLAAIIESVSGMDYNTYIRKFIFDPAGMTSTFAEVQKNIVYNRAHGYIKNEYRELENAPLADLSIKYAGGGLISTAGDLLKFADCLMKGILIKPSTLDTMLIPAKLSNGKIIDYGLGLSFGTENSGDYFFAHAGNGTGFSSFFVAFPREKLAAVCLVNINDRDLGNPALQLAMFYADKKYEKIKISLADSLLRLTLRSGIDSAINFYNRLQDDPDSLFINDKEELLFFGKDLLNINKAVQAISFFRVLAHKFPDDPEIFTILAKAYYYDKNKGLAIRNFRNVLKLDPGNKYAQKMIEMLKK
jgi:serine beta-lactamase-like protein LACTB